MWTISQGEGESPARGYHPPSEAVHRGPSASGHVAVSNHDTIVYRHTSELHRYAPALRFIFKKC